LLFQRSPLGARLFHKESAELPVSLLRKVRSLLHYIRYSFHSSLAVRTIVGEAPWRLGSAILLPVGFLLFLRDKLGSASRENCSSTGVL
jgi:hypothetical protein